MPTEPAQKKDLRMFMSGADKRERAVVRVGDRCPCIVASRVYLPNLTQQPGLLRRNRWRCNRHFFSTFFPVQPLKSRRKCCMIRTEDAVAAIAGTTEWFKH